MHEEQHVEVLSRASVCAISDALDLLSRKNWVFDISVRLVVGTRIFGRASPIMVSITGEKAHHKVGNQALDESPPGTVIVAAGEPDHCALYSAPEIELATLRKLGGLITDCCARTAGLVTESPVGVAARGKSPASGFGRVKTMAAVASVECAGVKVSRDDIVSGDETGVVVVPANLVAQVADIVGKMDERTRQLVGSVRQDGSIRKAVEKFWAVPA